MKPFRLFALGTLAALVLAPAAHALLVDGYAFTVNERFSSGADSSSAVANTSSSFLGASLDLSGIGWEGTTPFAVTMISPQYFITAAHIAPGVGSSVSFLNENGVVKTYTVGSVTSVQQSAGVNTDLVVGKLSAPISASDAITYYPTLQLGSLDAYANLPLFVYGANGRVGQNNIDGLFPDFDMLPFGGGDGTADSTLLVTEFDAGNPYETQAQIGDSGNPSFVVVGNTLALVGVHSAVNGNPPPQLTLDSFVPAYAVQIANDLAAGGDSLTIVTAVPEPAEVATWLAGAAGVVALVLRRRRREV